MKENILYFDIIGGISGDMTLASLLDLGVPKEIFLEELSKLNMDGEFEVEINYNQYIFHQILAVPYSQDELFY